MARGSNSSNQPLVQGAYQGLNRFKWEVASELGVQAPADGYMGDIPSRVNGAIGGHMVRRMIAAAEQSLISQAAGSVSSGFRSALSGSTGSSTSAYAGSYNSGLAGGSASNLGSVSSKFPSEQGLFPQNV